MGSKLVTRLYSYYVDGCTSCGAKTDHVFNDVDSVKRWFARHLDEFAVCEKGRAELKFHRTGRVQWRTAVTVP